jgi:hypothetical protein
MSFHPISRVQSGRWSGRRSPWQKPWASHQKGFRISGLSGERENGASGAPFFSLSLLLLGDIDVTFSRLEMSPFSGAHVTFSWRGMSPFPLVDVTFSTGAAGPLSAGVR